MKVERYCFLNKENYLLCRDFSIKSESRNIYEIFVENNYELYIFETPVSTRIICSSDLFQIHVWGKTCFNIWVLKKGLNKCFFSINTYLNNVSDGIYIISRNMFPEQLSKELIEILSYIKVMNTRGNYVFLIEEDVGIEIFFENIVYSRNTEKLLNHLYSLLKNKFVRIEDVNTYFELIKKNIFSNRSY